MNARDNPKLVHIAAARGDVNQRHGGIRRSNQLRADLNASLEFVLPSLSTITIFSFVRYLAYWRYVPKGLKLRGTAKALISVGLFFDFLETSDPGWRNHHFAVEIGRGPILYIGYALARLGVNYSAFPHNIEFLVPSQYNSDMPRGTHFYIESEIYKNANRIYTICELDSFIIKTIAPTVETITHPYYPDPTEVKRFNKIQNRRNGIEFEKTRLLYVGTVTNPPTKAGLKRLVEKFSTLHQAECELHVAGFGTEDIDIPLGSRIKIHGSVSDEELDELISASSAAIIVQPPTTGFLTRIIELNLSGIPVFVNSDYLQGNGLERFGIYTYSKIEDLLSRIPHIQKTKRLEQFSPASAIRVGKASEIFS